MAYRYLNRLLISRVEHRGICRWWPIQCPASGLVLGSDERFYLVIKRYMSWFEVRFPVSVRPFVTPSLNRLWNPALAIHGR